MMDSICRRSFGFSMLSKFTFSVCVCVCVCVCVLVIVETRTLNQHTFVCVVVEDVTGFDSLWSYLFVAEDEVDPLMEVL